MSRRRRHAPPPRSWFWLLAGLMLLGTWQVLQRGEDQAPVPARGDQAESVVRAPAVAGFLPPEAHATLALIDRGGPYPHRQDGTVFQNREGLLPAQPRGHYREFTVETPGAGNRGARRIVTGGDPPDEWYYTADHYCSFRAFSRQEHARQEHP